jgi:hypothetical protein
MNEQLDLVKVVQNTAENMFNLLMELASHIDRLEKENLELKAKLSDDFK